MADGFRWAVAQSGWRSNWDLDHQGLVNGNNAAPQEFTLSMVGRICRILRDDDGARLAHVGSG